MNFRIWNIFKKSHEAFTIFTVLALSSVLIILSSTMFIVTNLLMHIEINQQQQIIVYTCARRVALETIKDLQAVNKANKTNFITNPIFIGPVTVDDVYSGSEIKNFKITAIDGTAMDTISFSYNTQMNSLTMWQDNGPS